MICFLAPRDGTVGMEDYLRGGGSALRDQIQVLAYEDIFQREEASVGSYIFSALDQLTPTALSLVCRLRSELRRAAPEAALLNDPAAVLTRYDLLRRAFETGRNNFRVTRATRWLRRPRFPVFLRSEKEHGGSLTPLIWSRRGLGRELLLVSLRGYRVRDLLVVEYCGTADQAGIFRKYSAFIAGDTIVPRSLTISRDWVTKDARRIIDEQTAREEREYVFGNPHRPWLAETFTLARVEYGRIDYGMWNGRPQLWEINLNPTIGGHAGRRSRRTPEQRSLLAPAREHFCSLFNSALRSLASTAEAHRTIAVPVSAQEKASLEAERKEQFRIRARQTVIHRAVHPFAALARRITAGSADASVAEGGIGQR